MQGKRKPRGDCRAISHPTATVPGPLDRLDQELLVSSTERDLRRDRAIVRLLALGEPLSFGEIAKATGLHPRDVRASLRRIEGAHLALEAHA
jgi:DNA-binding transcriptional ArsR family regulator